ncbi:MAG TPA: CAP domain-containing protein [Solirubrobacteraceae bacterium]|nr:CAP domain-containing protein [Solirubrobacteraceae bacterium]
MPIPRHGWVSTRAARHPRPLTLLLTVLTVIGTTLLAVVPAATANTAHKHHRRHHGARAASGCAGANDSVGSTSAQVLRSAVVCLINQERAAHHLPALQASPLLDRSAQGWTNVMVSSDQFTHGTNFASRISAVGYDWRMAGENIATGFATPGGVVRAWMASTGHCENILDPNYRNVGTGISSSAVRGFATGAGTWTQDFALGMNQSSPSNNFAPANGCPY